MTKTNMLNRKTLHDLPETVRAEMVEILNSALVDSVDLFTQLKQAHWNLRGPNFIALHELFDEIAEKIEGASDLLAERAVQLGGFAHGTARIVARASRLSEYPANMVKDSDHVRAVAHALSQFGKNIRVAIDIAADSGDAGTADLFTELSLEADKQLWFVEAHLPVDEQ